MENKKWYQSKVVLANMAMGLAMMVAYFQPSVADFLKQYFAEAGAGWALVNVVLRVFKSNVEIS